MSPSQRTGRRDRVRFPRVSGDEPETTRMLLAYYEFSPRERG